MVVTADAADLVKCILDFVFWLLFSTLHIVIEYVMGILKIAYVAHERTEAWWNHRVAF